MTFAPDTSACERGQQAGMVIGERLAAAKLLHHVRIGEEESRVGDHVDESEVELALPIFTAQRSAADEEVWP